MSALTQIMPKRRNRIMDLVSTAGVNTDDWENYKGGPQKAAANPKYCYEWAFVEPGKVVVLTLWHEMIIERDGRLVREFNIRQSAQEYGEFPGKVMWGIRATRADKAIQEAIKSDLPIRAIICSGSRRGIDQSKTEASKVEKRLLDPVPWTITYYNWNTGQCTLTRGI
jgi:5-methylcytosine-specific restriction protein A